MLAGIAQKQMLAASAEPILLGFKAPNVEPFPAAACVGINERAVNAVPTDDPIKPDDIVHVDICLRLDGACADIARSRTISPQPGDDLPDRLNAMLKAWIHEPWVGRRASEIGERAERLADEFGLSILPEFLGHGIGTSVHQPPLITGPHEAGLAACRRSFPEAEPDPLLIAGQVFAVEIAAVRKISGVRPQTHTLADGWSRSVIGTHGPRPAAIRERMIQIGTENNAYLDPDPSDFSRPGPSTGDSDEGAG